MEVAACPSISMIDDNGHVVCQGNIVHTCVIDDAPRPPDLPSSIGDKYTGSIYKPPGKECWQRKQWDGKLVYVLLTSIKKAPYSYDASVGDSSESFGKSHRLEDMRSHWETRVGRGRGPRGTAYTLTVTHMCYLCMHHHVGA